MSTYKLMYFDGRGRAEVPRLLFAIAGTKYEDVRIAKEDWSKVKPTIPFGQLPVLEIDSKRYSQSVAIMSHLAREFGFYGKNTLESLAIDQVVQLMQDWAAVVVKARFESDAAKKAELEKNIQSVELPKYLGFFETLLIESGTGFFVGKSITLADICLFNMLDFLRASNPDLLEKFPHIKSLCDKVAANDKIKAYLAKRKPSDF